MAENDFWKITIVAIVLAVILLFFGTIGLAAIAFLAPQASLIAIIIVAVIALVIFFNRQRHWMLKSVFWALTVSLIVWIVIISGAAGLQSIKGVTNQISNIANALPVQCTSTQSDLVLGKPEFSANEFKVKVTGVHSGTKIHTMTAAFNNGNPTRQDELPVSDNTTEVKVTGLNLNGPTTAHLYFLYTYEGDYYRRTAREDCTGNI